MKLTAYYIILRDNGFAFRNLKHDNSKAVSQTIISVIKDFTNGKFI